MNKKIIVATMLACAALTAEAQRLTVDKDTVECGSVPYDTPVTATFELRNKGSRKLKITDVRVSCGCTKVEYPQHDVAGGDKFEVKLTFDARQLGHFYKQAAIYSNGSAEPTYLTMRGVVLAEVEDYTGYYPFKFGELMADKNVLEFDDVNKGDTPELQINIRNAGTRTLQPNVMHLPSYLSATVSPEALKPGRTGHITFTLNSEKLHGYGLTQTSVYLANAIGEKISADKEITVSSVLIPSFDSITEATRESAPNMKLSADSLVIDFAGKNRKSGEISITNEGKSTLEIKSLQMFTSGLRVTLGSRKLAAGESTTLKVTAYRNELSEASSTPRVLMITNDPNRPMVVVAIKTIN